MVTEPATRVPHEDSPAARCPYCGRPFGTSHRRDLHVGEDHAVEMSETEAEAYEAALERERDALFSYQLRVVIALGVIYTMTVIGLLVVLSGGP